MTGPQLQRVTAIFEPSFAGPIAVAISFIGEPQVTVNRRTLLVAARTQYDLARALAVVRPWEPFEPRAFGCDGITLRATVQTDVGTQSFESWSPTRREAPRAYDFFTAILDWVIALPLDETLAAAVREARGFFHLGLPLSQQGAMLAITAQVPEHLSEALAAQLEQLIAKGVQVVDLRQLQTLPAAALDALVRHPQLRFCATGTLLNALTERGVAPSRCFRSEVEASQALTHGEALLALKQKVLARVRGLPGVVSLRLEAFAVVIVVDRRRPAAVAALQALIARDFSTDPVRIE